MAPYPHLLIVKEVRNMNEWNATQLYGILSSLIR